MKKTKIAIACQGGGSQTAFTAGVLSSFFEKGVHLEKKIVSLSGTSGGALCASLAWFGLLKAAQGDSYPAGQRILDFWEDIIAKLPPETNMDGFACQMLRLVDKGLLPHYELSPSSPLSEMFLSSLTPYELSPSSSLSEIFLSSFTPFLPRKFFTDLKAALEEHIDFEELPNLVKPDSPVLLLGAADVCSGQLKRFNSRLGEIRVEALLASAAVPTLFKPVQIGEHYYWDGLFSDNPPVKELLRMAFVGAENVPDEIWVIQINPTEVNSIPKSPAEIIDRRNQMIGNVSLMQSLEFVAFWNMLLKEKAVDRRVLAKFGFVRTEPVIVRIIRMSSELQSSLDYVSKLSREPSHIYRLLEDGRSQGQKFLKSLARKRNGKPESTGLMELAVDTEQLVAEQTKRLRRKKPSPNAAASRARTRRIRRGPTARAGTFSKKRQTRMAIR